MIEINTCLSSNVFRFLDYSKLFLPLLAVIIITIFIYRNFKNKVYRILLILLSVPSIFIVLLGTLIYLLFGKIANEDRLRASNYFQMNAAIKNTCYLDPNMINCPHDLQGLLNLYPEDFNKITKKAKLTYKYYPETNEYTLIVRDRYNGAVIFDPRLSKYNERKQDFTELKVETCGKDRIVNPPPFPGPWDEIGEWL